MRMKAEWMAMLTVGCSLGVLLPAARGDELAYDKPTSDEVISDEVISDEAVELFAYDGEFVPYVGEEFVITWQPEGGSDEDFIAWSGVAEGGFEGEFVDHGFYEEEPFYDVDVTVIRGLEGGPLDDEALQTIDEPEVEVVIDWIDSEWIDEGYLEDGEVFVPEGSLDQLIYFSAAGPDSTGSIPEPTTACLLALTLAAAAVSRRGRR